MDAELTALVTAGATALVQQMATEAWSRTRDRVAAFLARRGADTPETVAAIAAELDAAREELAAAQQANDTDAAADVQGAWRRRMRHAVQQDPGAAAELRALLDALTPPAAAQSIGGVRNSITGGAQSGPVIQAGNIERLSFGG